MTNTQKAVKVLEKAGYKCHFKNGELVVGIKSHITNTYSYHNMSKNEVVHLALVELKSLKSNDLEDLELDFYELDELDEPKKTPKNSEGLPAYVSVVFILILVYIFLRFGGH